MVDHLSDNSDDEEIPEDEAFNSDDERKYGSFFQDRDESSNESDEGEGDDDSSGSEEDMDEDGDDGQYMLDLLDKLNGGDDKANDDEKESASAAISSQVKESEFASSVVPKAGLTLESLMEGLEDTKGFGVVQKTMKKVAMGTPTSAPLAKAVSNRARRKVHYEDQAKEVSMWIDAVQQNRRAETLDFRPTERMELTRDQLVDKFVPTTDFEKEIHAALEKAGQTSEEAILKAEEKNLQDDLGANEITLEEYKKRRGQLAKMRALLFYHEQKQHRIKKIKSKKYRRIRKRQRERQKEAEIEAQMEEDPDLARELAEKEEVDRMKERMTLAHKNTSKWAKRILKRGKNVDVDTRRALSAQLKRGDDLRQKMKSTRAGMDDDDDSEEEDLADAARKVLADTEMDVAIPAEREGLFKLSFMQKGIERQRQKSRQEARELLEELEADDDDRAESDGDVSVNDGIQEPASAGHKKPKKASKEEMNGVLNSSELVASQLKLGNSVSVAVSGAIDIDLEPEKDEAKSQTAFSGATLDANPSTSIETTSKVKRGPVECNKKSKKRKDSVAVVDGDEANPWLVAKEKNGDSSYEKAKVSRRGRKDMVDIDRAIDVLESTKNAMKHSGEQTNEDVEQDKVDASMPPAEKTSTDQPKKKITTLSQEELVKRAFASPSDKELESEFAAEKLAMAEEEESPAKKSRTKKRGKLQSDAVVGWGSWAGKGAKPPPPPGGRKGKLPKKLLPPEKKMMAKRKRTDDTKPLVIISEKRIKKTANKYMIADVPHPYRTREEYEAAMKGGVGREWNVTNSYKEMTRPDVLTRAGKIIQPLSKQVKRRRPKAKLG